jgi:hypothetical protein
MVVEQVTISTVEDSEGQSIKITRYRVALQRIKDHKTVIYVAAIFSGAFIIALLPALFFYPPAKISSPLSWILAYSIYASALAGLAAFGIDAFRERTNKQPFNWTSMSNFGWYIGVTLVTAVGALLLSFIPTRNLPSPGAHEFLSAIGSEKIAMSARTGMIDPKVIGSEKIAEQLMALLDSIGMERFGGELIGILRVLGNDKFGAMIRELEFVALFVVVGYLIADTLALRGGGDRAAYKNLVVVDWFIFGVHAVVIAVVVLGSSVYGARDFPATGRESFMGGFVALSLLLQSVAFSIIMSRPEKRKA